MTRVSQRTVYELRRDLEGEKMNRLPISYYDTHSNGDIMSRAINDMDNIASTLQQNLTQFITSIVTLVGVLWMMLTISWQLTLVALATVPLSLIVVMIVAPKSQKFFAAQQKSLGLLNNQVEKKPMAAIPLSKPLTMKRLIKKYLKKKTIVCIVLVGKHNSFPQSLCH